MRRVAMILGFLAAAAVARADVVYLKNGKTIEGQVVEEGEKVTVRMAFGTVSFPREAVERIERGESDVDLFDKKYAGLPEADADARVGLGLWCRERGLGGRFRKLLREAVGIDPDHAEARRLLGFVKHGDEWLTPDDRNRAMGLVEFEGQWLEPAAVAEVKKVRADALAAEELRRKAELELQIKVAEAEKLRAEVERLNAERDKLEAERKKLEAERTRYDNVFRRYPHFRYVGGALYFYPDYPVCKTPVLIVRSASATKEEEEEKK